MLDDADVEASAKTAATARNQNSGQSCIAAKRFIVIESVADEFERRFEENVAALTVGDPLDRGTNVGPLARDDLRDALDEQVKASVAKGARVGLGGERVAGKGYYYQPTVLEGVTPEMAAFREETFGPVAAVIRARDEDEALRLANDSQYGLGASVWSQDLERAQRFARRVEAGQVFVDGMVASRPAAAVRRRRAERLWAGVVGLRDQGAGEHPDDLGGTTRQLVRPALSRAA